MTGQINKRIEELLTSGKKMGLWRHGAAYKHYCKYQLFYGIDLKGKNVLEIGAGNGTYSMWCIVNGAKKVVALEPTADGADENSTLQSFKLLGESINANNLVIEEERIQDFKSDVKFDVVLLHYSINHIDEHSCINLLKDKASQDSYKEIFKKTYSMMNSNGFIVIVDCTDKSFWSSIGLTNPFAPTIEWYKHQSPQSWRNLLLSVGFTDPKISWAYDSKTLHFGRLLLSNKFISFFYTSIFVLRMKK